MNSRRHEAGECWWRTETGQGLGARKQECGRAGGGARAVLRGTLLWPQVAAGPVGAARCIFSHRTRFPQAPCPHVPHRAGRGPRLLATRPTSTQRPLMERGFGESHLCCSLLSSSLIPRLDWTAQARNRVPGRHEEVEARQV